MSCSQALAALDINIHDMYIYTVPKIMTFTFCLNIVFHIHIIICVLLYAE